MQMVNAKLGRKHQPISQGPKFSRVQFIPPMIQFKPADRVDREISGFLPLAHTVKELTGKLDTHQVEVGIGSGIIKDNIIPMSPQAPDCKSKLHKHIPGKPVSKDLIAA